MATLGSDPIHSGPAVDPPAGLTALTEHEWKTFDPEPPSLVLFAGRTTAIRERGRRLTDKLDPTKPRIGPTALPGTKDHGNEVLDLPAVAFGSDNQRRTG